MPSLKGMTFLQLLFKKKKTVQWLKAALGKIYLKKIYSKEMGFIYPGLY